MNPATTCTSCRLSAARTQVVWGHGPVPADLMVIGEAPGPQEDKAGVPFIGKAGQLLRQMLQEEGFDDGQIYFTNRAKCFPGYDGNSIAKPGVGELAACMGWLEQEIATVQPKVILCVGGVASSLPFPDLSASKAEGKWRAWRGRVWVATYHPSYVARGNREAGEAMRRTLREVRRFLESGGKAEAEAGQVCNGAGAEHEAVLAAGSTGEAAVPGLAS